MSDEGSYWYKEEMKYSVQDVTIFFSHFIPTVKIYQRDAY